MERCIYSSQLYIKNLSLVIKLRPKSVSEGVLRDIARGLSFFIYKYEHRNVEEISICTS